MLTKRSSFKSTNFQSFGSSLQSLFWVVFTVSLLGSLYSLSFVGNHVHFPPIFLPCLIVLILLLVEKLSYNLLNKALGPFSLSQLQHSISQTCHGHSDWSSQPVVAAALGQYCKPKKYHVRFFLNYIISCSRCIQQENAG